MIAIVKTRQSVKVTISPVDHFVGARFSRRAWIAGLEQLSGEPAPEFCEHDHGHRTIEAAKKCGLAMWRRLPDGSAVYTTASQDGTVTP